MPKRKLDFRFTDYKRVEEPNYALLASLTKTAMGNRNMSEFAKDCGLSVATISRVLGAKFQTPIADGIIKAIADGAVPGSVSLQAILEAHGLAKNIGLPEEKSYNSAAFGAYFEKAAIDIITASLLNDGFTADIIHHSMNETFNFDCVIETNAFERIGVTKWALDTFCSNGRLDKRRIDDKMNRLLAYAYCNSCMEQGLKLSLVTDSKENFVYLKRNYTYCKIADCISFVYIDSVTNCFEDEFVIPRK